MSVRLAAATARRRLLAGLIDAGCCAAISAIPYILGIFTIDDLVAPEGIFWPDHALALLGRSPVRVLAPGLWALAVWCVWQFAWVTFWRGWTPGGRAASVQIVDGAADAPGWSVAALRVVGHAASAASLGLGWLWVLVSPSRRSWADLASGSAAVRR